MANYTMDDFLRCCGSTQFAELMTNMGPFSSLSQAIEASREIWWNKVNVPGWLQAFSAHPRIGDVDALKREKPAAEWCKGEQSVAMETATGMVLQELAEWNRRYDEKFGFCFLICASGKSSSEILSSLKKRFSSRPVDELQVAATEQQKITEIRLNKLFAERDSRPAVSSDRRIGQIGGHLGAAETPKDVKSLHDSSVNIAPCQPASARPPITTHVLDVSRGKPGAGIDVLLEMWKGNLEAGHDESGDWIRVGSSITNGDGRSGPLMSPSNTVTPGRYKLTFNTGKYFQKLCSSSDQNDVEAVVCFYPYISVVFEIKPRQASEHFHVPVLLSPFSFTTYRGS